MNTPTTLASAPVSADQPRDVTGQIANLIESPLFTTAALAIAALIVGLIAHLIIFAALRRSLKREATENPKLAQSISRLKRGTIPAIPLLIITLGIDFTSLHPSIAGNTALITGVLLIITLTYAAVITVGLVAEYAIAKHPVTGPDNLAARRMVTRVSVLRRTIQVIVTILGVGVALYTIPEARAFGTTLLASAGIAGIVVGVAAQPTLASLVAGVQIALTQPIRLDDVVIIDGEWGRIEEITLTYVVVRVWDQRRLIVPLSKVTSESFQNWTRTSAELLGTVFVYADHTVDIDAMRKALDDTLENEPLFDGRVKQIVVTDITEHTVQLRALVSAKDAGSLWDLRCKVREALTTHLRDQQPNALPKLRGQFNTTNPQPS